MVTPPAGDWGALTRFIHRVRDYLFGWLPDREVLLRFGRRIRNVVIVMLAAFFGGLGVTWWQRKEIFRWLLEPADGRLSPFEGGLPVFTAPTDPFAATVVLAIQGGLVLAFPVFVIGLFYIARPMLSAKYQRFFLVFLPSSFLFFI